MLSMYRQLTGTLTKDTKVLPKSEGEIYRLRTGGDRWGYRKCNRTDDRFDMLEHAVKGISSRDNRYTINHGVWFPTLLYMSVHQSNRRLH